MRHYSATGARWLFAAVPLALAAPAAAEDRDAQVWASTTVNVRLSERVTGTMEVHTRFTDDVAQLGQILLRPSLTLNLPRNFSVTAGYLYFRNDPIDARATGEHRTWQQLGFRFLGRPGRVLLTGRTRIEQRFRVGAPNDTGWRLRQQTRLQVPLRANGGVSALAWNETFVGLNRTGWGARAGLDQVRSFVGVAVPLSDRLTLEPGYLNQYVVRDGRPDRLNHVASATLVVRL